MIVKGAVVGRGIATQPDGMARPYRLIVPTNDPASLDWMANERERWRRLTNDVAGKIASSKVEPGVWRRSQFAVEVLEAVESSVRLGACCSLICQGTDERILGVTSYSWLNTSEGALNLQCIEPSSLAGSPGRSQRRGVGTALTAAVARAFLITRHTVIYLHPLDNEAAHYWMNRGFTVCGRGGLMCIRGESAIKALRNTCENEGERGDQPDSLLCGMPAISSELAQRR